MVLLVLISAATYPPSEEKDYLLQALGSKTINLENMKI
jgi:hypothetical protein